jgi:2,4-dienoyl-CoA reductase-like NADH-dependent reductase (Old Yellow Enzyme family)
MTAMLKHVSFPPVPSFKTAAAFKTHLATLPIPLACDDALQPPEQSALARPLEIEGRTIGNRFCIHAMGGLDGTGDGKATELVTRRWVNFGRSGAKLIWGGEAVAISRESRDSPFQLYYHPDNRASHERLLRDLRSAHRERFGTTDDLLVGVQITHSGRYSRPEPDFQARPRIAYRHPLLDARSGVEDDRCVLSDMELEGIVGEFAVHAKFAQEAGFDFVDVKQCHAYLLHEMLSARTRPGRYGGSFENRTRLFREIVGAIRREAPGLLIGTRISIFDAVPFQKPAADPTAAGEPVEYRHLLPYEYGFGVDPLRPTEPDLTEPLMLLRMCEDLGIRLVNVSAGSPYYNPHIQRPARHPPCDGYYPPEDPLTGCARMIEATARCKAAFPGLILVGTGYSYLQEYLAHVAQAQVRLGRVDSVGIGRLAFAYPDYPHDLLSGAGILRKRLCRTDSDCTTSMRNRLVSGCYPYDPFYKARPEAERLRQLKRSFLAKGG